MPKDTVIPKVTLDTNVPYRYWEGQENAHIAESLLDLKRNGLVDLAINDTNRSRYSEPAII